jgi:hypothetical protein
VTEADAKEEEAPAHPTIKMYLKSQSRRRPYRPV